MDFKSLLLQSLFYLSFPFLLFCVGFLRWYVAIIMVAAVLWSTYSIYRLHSLDSGTWKIDRSQIVGSIAVALCCCFLF